MGTPGSDRLLLSLCSGHRGQGQGGAELREGRAKCQLAGPVGQKRTLPSEAKTPQGDLGQLFLNLAAF